MQVQSDCTELVRAIESQQQPFEISSLVHDIKVLCSKFDHCLVSQVGRGEVVLAHELAIAVRLGKIIS